MADRAYHRWSGFDILKLLTRARVRACVRTCVCVCASVSLKTYKYSIKRARVGCEVGKVSASVVTISVIGCPFGPRNYNARDSPPFVKIS